ncbi:MAG TPA: hypothetical protein VJG66_04005 [Patescibacteria group bacterium]|nr:hypothetical protein [Patescibacteria group bacterium]
MEAQEGPPSPIRVFELNQKYPLVVSENGSKTERVRLILPGQELEGSLINIKPGGLQRGLVYAPYDPEVSADFAKIDRRNGLAIFGDLLFKHHHNPHYYRNHSADSDKDHPNAQIWTAVRMQNPTINALLKDLQARVSSGELNPEQTESELQLLIGANQEAWSKHLDIRERLRVTLELPPFGDVKNPIYARSMHDFDLNAPTRGIAFEYFYPLEGGPLAKFDMMENPYAGVRETRGAWGREYYEAAEFAKNALAQSGFPLRLSEEVLQDTKISFSLTQSPRMPKFPIKPLPHLEAR